MISDNVNINMQTKTFMSISNTTMCDKIIYIVWIADYWINTMGIFIMILDYVNIYMQTRTFMSISNTIMSDKIIYIVWITDY